ncbi:hypothetical protein EBU71_06205, partial [bacterium]|nr:hypothetical protein [Candidatus Elulimicrobium humile]
NARPLRPLDHAPLRSRGGTRRLGGLRARRGSRLAASPRPAKTSHVLGQLSNEPPEYEAEFSQDDESQKENYSGRKEARRYEERSGE